MPFIYREKTANINRLSKRSDEFIDKKVVEGLDSLCNDEDKIVSVNMADKVTSISIKILPSGYGDPSFKKAKPRSSLVTLAIKELGLSWFEIEHWLDIISSKDRYKFYLETGSIFYIDERKRYYADRYIRSHLHYRI